MNKSTKIIGLFSTIVLYLFIVNAYGIRLLSSDTTFDTQQTLDNQNYFSLLSSNLFCPSLQFENGIAGTNELPSTSNKRPYFNFLSGINNADLFFENTSAKYIFYSKNIIIQFQETDIIYPFHSFS